jgi:hypothetical protein
LAIEQLGFRKSAATVVAKRRIEQISGRAANAGRRMGGDVHSLLGGCATLSSVHEVEL